MKDACQRYLEDPEAHSGHLAECEECRALFDTLGIAVEERPLSVGALPLAPWEGATHRSWPLILAVAAMLLVFTTAVCAWAGVAPRTLVTSSLAFERAVQMFIVSSAEGLRTAWIGWQVLFGFALLVVNTVLVLLLRRAPRGIDA